MKKNNYTNCSYCNSGIKLDHGTTFRCTGCGMYYAFEWNYNQNKIGSKLKVLTFIITMDIR